MDIDGMVEDTIIKERKFSKLKMVREKQKNILIMES